MADLLHYQSQISRVKVIFNQQLLNKIFQHVHKKVKNGKKVSRYPEHSTFIYNSGSGIAINCRRERTPRSHRTPLIGAKLLLQAVTGGAQLGFKWAPNGFYERFLPHLRYTPLLN